MKNWNYIEGAKTGNIKDDAKAKELHKKMMDAKEIAEEWGRASYSQKKDNLEGGRKAAEDAYRKAKKEYEDYAMNTKTGNMLLNVVAVEIGKPWMIYYDTEADEYYTDYKGTIHDNPGFRTKQEAINYVKKRMKTENKKTGNDTPWEYAHRKPKVINEDKTGAEEFFKKLAHDVDEREKKDDAEIKLVGNETYQHKLYPDKYVIIEGKNYKIITDGKVEKTGVLTDAVLYGINQTYKKVGNAQWDRAYYKQMIDPVKWNEFEKKFEKLIYDQNLERYDMEDRMSLKPELRSEKYKMIERQRKDVESMINKYRKTGNARYTTKEDVISHLDTDLYDICKKVPSGSPSFAYISELQKKGWDMNTISKYSKEIGKIIDRYKVGNKNLDWNTGTIDWDVANFNGQWYITKNGQKLKGPFPSMKEAERYLDGHKWELQDKYGNKQTGNVQYHKVGKISIRLEANDDDWTVYDDNGNELKSGKGGLGRAKTWAEHFARFTNKKAGNSKWELPDGSTATVEDDGTIKIKKPRDSSIYTTKLWDKERAEKQLAQKGAKKVGNSASDDKFAYVMREFDAGKLKTPDGKVVTDPAQAKAIAYSESKKTENGLARARKAMNKGITMWKGNDSAYIKEDGTVSYLENNSFETDKDKFESQESAIKELSKQGYVKK